MSTVFLLSTISYLQQYNEPVYISMESLLVIVMSTFWWIMMPHKWKPKCHICSMCCLCICQFTGLAYVKHHLDQTTEDEMVQVGQHSSDEEDLFSSLKPRKSQGPGELDGYLACVLDKMDLLNSFPYIKKLSLKHWPACLCRLWAPLQLCWTTVHCKAS